MYFITGRASVDILKSGGYKISAIEIERAILELPYIKEAAVVGVTDAEYGQRVGAALVTKSLGNASLSLGRLRQDLKQKLAKYKLPTVLRLIHEELPKGPTGKVQKKVLCETLFPSPGWEHDQHVEVWRSKANKASKL
jgi:malonyl-CoA/methylmalonyl-CoA synthetase